MLFNYTQRRDYMRVSVAASAAEAAYHNLSETTVVVIDVLRATTVITTALANGAEAIIPVTEIDEAKSLAEELAVPNLLLAGERQALLIPGFDLGNSPLAFCADRVRDKLIIMTTSNGTRALQAAKQAPGILVGCLLNAAAIAKELLAQEHIMLLCSGTANRADMSDCMAAAAILTELQNLGVKLDMDDFARLCLAFYVSSNIHESLSSSLHGKRLLHLGLEQDIRYCSQLNSLDIVPVYDGERIRTR